MFIGQKFQEEMKSGKKQPIANTSEQQFKVEFECEFLGSVDTLIAPSKLRTLFMIIHKPVSAGLMYMKISDRRIMIM
jgi:hypothetical protein